jgi:nucleotide-binding universal stress UspA family protein
MLKQILVPVDFSNCSYAALRRAAELARSTGAKIDLLHVWEVTAQLPPDMIFDDHAPPGQILSHAILTHAQRHLDELVKQAKAEGTEIRETRLVRGATAHTIVEIAEKDGYDLIAMGTHGRSGFERLLLGSITEKVVRRSTVPVLTVREASSG